MIYGIVKLACEFELKTIATRLGINYNTAIIGSSFGPGDMSNRIHNAVITSLLEGEEPMLVACNNLHDWVYIDEIAEMFYAIGEKNVNLKNYYLVHNTLKPLKDIILEVGKILNPQINIKFVNVPGDLFIDYSLVDINALYTDTNYSFKGDFQKQIINTANRLKYEKKACVKQ